MYSRATTSSTAERCFLPEPEVVFLVLGASLAIAAVVAAENSSVVCRIRGDDRPGERS